MTVAKDLQNFQKKFQKKLGRNLTKSEVSGLGKLAIDIIVKRTRRGSGVKRDGGAIRRLKPLKKSYVAQRRRLISKLSRFTSPNKSNLTFTGQMLSSIKVIKTVKTRTGVGSVISPKGRRSDGKTNEEVAVFASLSRPFFHLAKKEKRELIEVFEKRFKKAIKKR